MNRIGIIGAMDEEVDVLKKEMEVQDIKNIANMDFYIGKLANREIVLVRCGIGKVNAAVCTQILIGQLSVGLVINTGVAGGVHDSLEVLDVVISTDVQQHDFDVTAFGHKKGVIPRMESSIFLADENLISLAQKSSSVLGEDIKVVQGVVVSGDIFVSSNELKESLKEEFEADCAEMEGAAIAHVCAINKMPFLVIRSMSDKANGEAPENFDEFVLKAAKNSKKLILKMIELL